MPRPQHDEPLPWMMMVPDVDLSPEPPLKLKKIDPAVRVWSERDAAFEIIRDLDHSRCESLRTYARRFGWGENGHKALQRLLRDKLGLRIEWDNRNKINKLVELKAAFSRFGRNIGPSRTAKSTRPRLQKMPKKPTIPASCEKRAPSREPRPNPVAEPSTNPAARARSLSQDINKNININTPPPARAWQRDAFEPKPARFEPPPPPKLPLPEGFDWNPALETWAKRRHPDIPLATLREYVRDHFVPRCRAGGYRYADHNQACVSWINRDLQDRSRGFFAEPKASSEPRRRRNQGAARSTPRAQTPDLESYPGVVCDLDLPCPEFEEVAW